MSGADDPEVASTAPELGAYGYVVKPFRTSQILISTANALRHHELERAARAQRDALERAVSDADLGAAEVPRGDDPPRLARGGVPRRADRAPHVDA